MSDTPTNSLPPPVSLSPATGPVLVGFLTILPDVAGLVGGYLLTNHWGRPLEFRHSTAVQASRVHEILYGPTLTEYLHADLIGKTLVEKSSTRPSFIITDSFPGLALATRVQLPIVVVNRFGDAEPPELVKFQHPRCKQDLFASSEATAQELTAILDRLDAALELLEPFTRLQEAMQEARKLGANQRAA